ncbi:MAG: DUF4169 family protein [Pseudomonadota bacterium]
MPGDVINLRQRRKDMKRAADRARADANALKHGLPLSVTRLDDARAEKVRRDHEGHRVGDEKDR